MHKLTVIILLSLFFQKRALSQSDTSLTFSEIMFAPLSGQSEFVEIYNTSSTDTIDLSGFKLKYLHTSNTDNIIPQQEGINLAPSSFAIIFEEDYNFNSGVYNSLIPAKALILKIDNGSFASGLSNSTDRTLLLINSSGDTLDTYTYSADNSKGFSDEKIILNKNNSTANWGNSLTENGTPGIYNSISPLEFDLSLSNIYLTPEIQFAGSNIKLSFTINNYGTNGAAIYSISIFDDINSDSSESLDELIYYKDLSNLKSGDSINVSTDIDSLSERKYSIIIKIDFDHDKNPLNNTFIIEFTPLPKPAEYNEIVINEIMYKPINDEPEWIEIYNNGERRINLEEWHFSDRVSRVKITDDPLIISPHEYLVLSEDESIFDFYKIESETFILKLPSLNNGGDDLYIYDQYDNIIDSVLYFEMWGGNDGNSLERVSTVDSSNAEYNWASAVTKNKATPGKINSITTKDFDLQISMFNSAVDFIIFPSDIEITAAVYNKGINNAESAILNFYNDTNNDSTAAADELIYTRILTDIDAGTTIFTSFIYDQYIEGNNSLIAELYFGKDEDFENNTAFTSFRSVRINEKRNDIIINEFMHAPDNNSPEWIEIYNRSEKKIDLLNYRTADDLDTITVVNKSVILSPGEYFLIVGDTSFFHVYDTVAELVIHDFPTLNNNSDRIIILDSLNRVIDSLSYNTEWNFETGKSIERIDTEAESTEKNNWRISKDRNGATPGKINSVTQKIYNVGISQIVTTPVKPKYGENVKISAVIYNNGRVSSDFNISLIEQNNLIESSANIMLSSIDSILYEFNYIISGLSAEREFFAEINYIKDQDTTDNRLSVSIKPGYSYNSILINEIMYTPQNGEPEWIEVCNNENYKIDLSSWIISDLLAVPEATRLIDPTIYIQPKSYFVISKDSSINNFYDINSSGIYISQFANLNNSEDGIVLRDSYGELIDSVHYDFSWRSKTGYSIERISLEEPSNESSNWSYSTDINQATPGKRNSLSKKNNDISIEKIYLSSSMPKHNEYVSVNAVIANPGLTTAYNFSVRFFINNNIWDEVPVNSLNRDDTITIKSNKDLQVKGETIIAAVINYSIDEDTLNNFSQISLRSGYYYNDIIINEFMADPTGSEPEWIEFYNNSNDTIDLKKWNVSDVIPSQKLKTLSDENFIINPGEYFIITSDTILFKIKHPQVRRILNVDFGTLGNTEDGVIIYDSYNSLIDSVEYNSDWNVLKGVSIERLSIDQPTQNPTNWKPSININGSTPGYLNSIAESQEYSFNQVIINEIMYEPGETNSEFLEFYNNSNSYVELGGWTIENEKGEYYRISNSNYTMSPDSYYVASADSSILDFYRSLSGDNSINIINRSDLNLTNEEQLIMLKDLKGNVIDTVRYNSKWHNPNVLVTKNKSLERLNPKLNSNGASNWSTSANADGATPGSINSIYTDNLIKQSGLSISPNPFSPDNDGFEDFCTINYSLGTALSQIRIKIFDDRGRLVRILANNQPAGSTGSIIFDGLNENRSPLKIGMYIVFFEATNAQTGQQEILKDVVVIARKL